MTKLKCDSRCLIIWTIKNDFNRKNGLKYFSKSKCFLRGSKWDIFLTGGGRILMIPCCSAIGLIFSKYPKASWNSSTVGVKQGHSGGATKSYSQSVAMLYCWPCKGLKSLPNPEICLSNSIPRKVWSSQNIEIVDRKLGTNPF